MSDDEWANRAWDDEFKDMFTSLSSTVGPAELSVEGLLRAMDDIGRRSSFPCVDCGYEGAMYRLMETERTVLYRECCGCGERVRKYAAQPPPLSARSDA